MFVGFVGIIIITEPGYSSLNVYYIFPVIFVLGMSYVAISIRQLSTTEPVWLISLFFSIAITLASFFSIPWGWKMPDFLDLFLSTGGNNNTGYANSEFDDIILRRAPQASSRNQRYELFFEAETMLMEEMPFIPFYTYSHKHQIHPSVQGNYPDS
mgnify:CR=1 FL=1